MITDNQDTNDALAQAVVLIQARMQGMDRVLMQLLGEQMGASDPRQDMLIKAALLSLIPPLVAQASERDTDAAMAWLAHVGMEQNLDGTFRDRLQHPPDPSVDGSREG